MTIRHAGRGTYALAGALFALGAFAIPRSAAAATYYYVDWSAANVAGGTASGTITLPDSSTVNVTFAAVTQSSSAGSLYGAQINGVGTNYWSPTTPYVSAAIENPPPTPDILQLSGGQNETYTVSLSQPIKDPIMAIVSLGSPGTATTYDFDSPFTIVSQAAGYFGGSSTALVMLANNVLQGTEGSGTIQFIGTFSTFSWTVPTPETWHGFTFGIRTTEALEPNEAGAPDGGDAGPLDAGLVDASVVDASVVDASVTDASVTDASAIDASIVDASVPDASMTDASVADASPLDASPADAAVAIADAASPVADAAGETVTPTEDAGDDAAIAEAGDEADASTSVSTISGGGCGCSTAGSGLSPAWLPIGSILALAGLAERRRRAKRSRSSRAR